MNVVGMKRLRSEKGVALLETALTLPLVLLITMGAIEFGRAYQTWQVLTNAAREGARVAVLPGTSNATVANRVEDYMAAGQLGAAAEATVTVTRDNAVGVGTATASRVVVEYPFEFIVLQPVAQLVVSGSTVGAPITMTASAMMRNE